MIHILFTADHIYVERIPTVIKSIKNCHKGSSFHIHLISNDVKPVLEDKLRRFCRQYDYFFDLYRVPEELFSHAPVNKHYSKAMYFRMLAFGILPKTLNKVSDTGWHPCCF